MTRALRLSTACRLLGALRTAGCDVFIDREDGHLYVSPPLRHVNWNSDVEQAIEEWYDELKALVHDERVTVH